MAVGDYLIGLVAKEVLNCPQGSQAMADSKGREPIESEAATPCKLVLIPCCATGGRRRDS